MQATGQAESQPRLRRVVIATNEPRERSRLLDLCQRRDGLDDPVIAQSGAEALRSIRSTHADLAVLACELHDMSGFDVLRALGEMHRPPTIMVAPDERHAAEAQALAATDYLTMPVSSERFTLALTRAFPVVDKAVPELRGEAGAQAVRSIGYGDRLLGERAKRLYFLSPADIDYVEADSNYVRMFIGTESYMNRDSLGRLAPLLQGVGFVRISRSILLNLQRVSYSERVAHGALAFTLKSGSRVVSSITFRLEAGAHLRVARAGGSRPQ